VNLKKTSNLRNSPYCDLKAIKVEKTKENNSNSRRSSQSSQAVADTDTRLSSWLDRRMSSPRAVSRSPGRRTPEGKTPEPKFLDEGMRRRGGSTPVKKHVKRDPSHSNKRKRPAQSAPKSSNVVTPAKDVGTPETELKHVMNRLQPKSRPQSAKTSLEGPSTPNSRCLRCQEDDVKECTHKPPHSRSNKEPKAKSEAHLNLALQDTNAIAECARLRQVVDDLRLQLATQQQNSHPNVQQSYNYQRHYKTPSLHVSYDQAIKNKHYDTIFAHSPSVSPSSSPVPDMFHDPEKFLPFLNSGGKPSSTRSDILMGASNHKFDPMAHHYGTPYTQEVYFPEADDFFSESRSSTSTPSWATNSEQLSARECLDYYERRKSPREMSEVLCVPPVELETPAHVHGERRPHPKQHIPHPLVNQDPNLNKADSSRWAPVSDEDFRFNTPTKRSNRYKLPTSLRKKKHSKKPASPYRW